MIYPRISARLGEVVNLDVNFFHAGVLADPYAIFKVEIYRTAVVPHNLIATIFVADPNSSSYPLPVQQRMQQAATGLCGTEPPTSTIPMPGQYGLMFTVPSDFSVPDVYFDVWYYYPNNPLVLGTDPTEDNLGDPSITPQLLRCCHRFWVYPDQWFCDDGLQTVNFGFEPLSQRFHSPEVRPLEVGIMPLPLYDYNYNLVNPLMPFLQATISFETQYHEILVEDAAMTIGVRQGSYRSNPYVLRYNVDTTKFLKGTYRYRVLLQLPDGTTRASKYFIMTVD